VYVNIDEHVGGVKSCSVEFQIVPLGVVMLTYFTWSVTVGGLHIEIVTIPLGAIFAGETVRVGDKAKAAGAATLNANSATSTQSALFIEGSALARIYKPEEPQIQATESRIHCLGMRVHVSHDPRWSLDRHCEVKVVLSSSR
jgi:hypothetical protein